MKNEKGSARSENFEGTLTIQVLTGSKAYPVEGAHIILSRETKGGEELIKTMITDSAGRTEAVSLPAPSPEESLSYSEGRPYFVYNVRVDKMGYYTVEDLNIPIFSGVSAVQPVSLVPLPFGETDGKTKFFIEDEPMDLRAKKGGE